MSQLLRGSRERASLEPVSVPRSVVKRILVNSVTDQVQQLVFLLNSGLNSKISQIKCAERSIPHQHAGLSSSQLARAGRGRPPLEPLSVPRPVMEFIFIKNLNNRLAFLHFFTFSSAILVKRLDWSD